MTSSIFSARSSQRGFTLVELIVAIGIFLVLALASGTLYGVIAKVYTQDKLTQDLQREADEIMAHMSRNLKEATRLDQANSNLTTDPNSLRVFLESGAARSYSVVAGQLHYVSETGHDENLLAPGTSVSSLTFVPTSVDNELKSVKVEATLSRTKGQYNVTLTVGSTIDTRPQ